MPFKKCNITFNKSFGSSPRTITIENEEGILEEKTEECNKKLPDAENFEIANQIAAGINLQETNTKILGDKINEKELEKAIKTIKKQKENNNNKDNNTNKE